ncbi:diguanylate cyclase domain-containing protein [Roseovarius salis]|uniref:diguanylate cyclase domain-containing protein n=1 Tax=Roseovarius salis TaxID=3376063 RepID=UPI0037C8396B
MTGVPPLHVAGRYLDTLCPMHAVLDSTGHVVHAGPTLHRVVTGQPLVGSRLLEILELQRPRATGTMESLLSLVGLKLHFALRRPPRTELKGVLVPLDPDSGNGPPGRAVINLSFGISIIEAVRDFGLTGKDFAATDLAVEMLYLVEAKSAVMEELRRLNLRLNGARLAAEEQAFTDTLTGLRNRRAIGPVLARLADTGEGAALVQLDLDGFKAVNDSHGHAAGDRVLQAVAQRLTAATRAVDAVIRTGGDEFLLILPGLTDPAEVACLAERLIAVLVRPVPYNGVMLEVSASIGASVAPHAGALDPGRMLEEADTALYAVKQAGRKGYRIYAPELGRMGRAGGTDGSA